LWTGVTPGPFAAGFRFRQGTDTTRSINAHTRGTALGLAVWYPALPTANGPAITQLEYRLLSFAKPLSESARRSFLDDAAGMMVNWRHVGIVPLTLDQARAALQSRGRAIRDAAPAPGKFPVVLILGGQWYLSTTAEILASHGYVVAAPVRFSDEINEVPTMNFTWGFETALRDAEWALAELSADAHADSANVTALGHGGGGMQALLLGMRNRAIRAVANIDAANFSTRSNPSQLPFYDKRLLRAPYLYLARSETQQQSDLFADFEQMLFSQRYEVILRDEAVRHHDLSDVGRGISAALGIRGDAQETVLRNYADVQQILVRFFDAHGRPESAATPQFAPWLRELSARRGYTVSTRSAVEPAPTTAEIIQSLDQHTPERLAAARRRDPQAPLFSEGSLVQLVTVAQIANQPVLAASLARFALDVHPKSIPIFQAAGAALESAGDRTAAREAAARCAAFEAPPNDWRAAAAQGKCREQIRRLQQ
jgi:hypothetical protein